MAKVNAGGGYGAAAGTPSVLGFDAAAFNSNLEPIFEAGSKLFDNWRAVSDELCEFGKSRLARNIEASRRIAQSESFDAAFNVQADFARGMMQDYVVASGKFAELGSRAIAEGFAMWKRSGPAPSGKDSGGE